VSVQLGWSYRGFEVVFLENDLLRVAVVPQMGAKIYQFIDKRIDRDLLYHHPRVDLRPPVFGVNVDNWWTGGIDDVVPTGHPCTVGGEELPYLGELWSVPWDLEILDSSSIRLTGRGTITPLSLRRTMTLLPGERQLRVQYELANSGFVRFPYLWGVHPALPIGPRTRVDVPARESWYSDGDVAPDEPSLGPGQTVAAPWPVPSLERLNRAPGGTWVHLYLSALQDGWVTVSDAEEGWGFGVRFSTDQFSNVHLWLVDGGWRGLRCVAIEPWTGRPSRLDQAIEQGRARWLGPGERASAAVNFVAFTPSPATDGNAEDLPRSREERK
jgi:Domain of unknown function (DUF5107)